MKLFSLIGILVCLAVAARGQECNFSVQSQPVSCFGSADGSAEIWYNGSLLVPGNNNNNGNPPGCAVAETSPYSCASPVPGAEQSSETSGVVIVPAGKTLYLTAASFDGNIRFTGSGTLIICGQAVVRSFEMNNNSQPVTIIINGMMSLSSPSLNLDAQSTVKNYGRLILGQTVGFNGYLYNYGILQADQTLNINAPKGVLYNAGEIDVKGSLTNFNEALNEGLLRVAGMLHNNGGSGLINRCRVEAGQLMNSTTMANHGRIGGLHGGEASVNLAGGSLYKGYGGSLLKSSDIIVDGIAEGSDTACAAIRVSNSTLINGSGLLRGKLDFCDVNGIETNTGTIQSPAVTDCQCPANGDGQGGSGTVNATVEWSGGTPFNGGGSVRGLTAGSYTVSVEAEGCATWDTVFSIGTPSRILSSVAVTDDEATVSASGGNAGGFQYLWKKPSTGWQTLDSSPVRAFASAGSYTVTVIDSKGCEGDPLPFVIQDSGPGDECDFSVVVTPVTCYGGNDGTVTVYKDGEPLTIPGGGNGGGGEPGDGGIPQGNPGACMQPLVSPYSCSAPVSGAIVYTASTGTIEIESGQTVYLTASSYTGDLLIDGGTLVVCGRATIQNFNYKYSSAPPFELVINGNAELSAPNLNLKENHTVKNFGSLTTNSIGFNGSLENHGTLQVNGDLSFNTAENRYLNTGTITVESNFNNKFTTINGGRFHVKGIFNNNESTSLFRNYCRLEVDGQLNNNRLIENRGYILVVNQRTTFNSNAVYEGWAGSVLYTKEFMHNGSAEGMESCASIRVATTTDLNNTSVLDGFLSLCDGNSRIETNNGFVGADVSLDCRCGGTVDSTAQGPLTWSDKPGYSGNPLTGQPAGTGTVTIVWPGCDTVVLSYTIEQPSAPVTAGVVVSDGTATVTASGGNGTPYTYRWNPDQARVSSASRYFAYNGTYTVTVFDSLGCEGPTLSFVITGQDEGGGSEGELCGVTVSYLPDNQVSVVIDCPPADPECTFDTLMTRPCKDSILVLEQCGRLHTVKVKGSRLCSTCDPETDLAEDSLCYNSCDLLADADCPCDPAIETCDSCDPLTDPGCPVLKVTYVAAPAGCYQAASAVLTISGGSGNYGIKSNAHTGVIAGGHSPLTLYDMPEGDSTKVTVTDYVSGQTRSIYVYIAPAPVPDITISQSALPEGDCEDQLYISIANAPAGTYTLRPGCCEPWYIEQQASAGSLTLGPYTIPSHLGNTPFVVKVTDPYCREYDRVMTRCLPECTDPGISAYVPSVTKTRPGYKGRRDGRMEITNLPSGVRAYWSGPGLYAPVEGAVLSGVGAGNYHVLLIDENGGPCQAERVISLPDGPRYRVRYTKVADCVYEAIVNKYEENGSLSSIANDEPLQYSWFNPNTGGQIATGRQIDAAALAAQYGISGFRLRVTDARNTSVVYTMRVPATCLPPDTCTASVTWLASDPVCVGDANGTIEVTGYSAGHYVTWTSVMPGGYWNMNQTGLGAGWYRLALHSNDPACPREEVDIYLHNPAPLLVQVEELGTGGVTIHVQNGRAPYLVQWTDNESTGATRTDLVPGTAYTVTITDAANCRTTHTFIYDPCALSSPRPYVLLQGSRATLVPTAGVAPYSYAWLGGTIADRSLKVQEALAPGLYTAVVTDALGCADSLEFDAEQCGETIDMTIAQQAARADLCDGRAVVSLDGVSDYSGYRFLWDRQPLEEALTYTDPAFWQQSTRRILENVCAGLHSVAVITPSGCVVQDTFRLGYTSPPENPCGSSPGIVTPLGTSFSRSCVDQFLQVDFSVQGGGAPYRYVWIYERPGAEPDTFRSDKPGLYNPAPGSYALTVYDRCDNSATASFTIGGPSEALSATQQTEASACHGEDGILHLQISGGTPPYTITWADESTTASSSGEVSRALPPGIQEEYSISDAGHCTYTGSASQAGKPFGGRIYYNRLSFCPGSSGVRLAAAAVPGYRYQWSGTAIAAGREYDATIELNTPGLVSLTYTPADSTGCTYAVTDTVRLSLRDSALCVPQTSLCEMVEIAERDIILHDPCSVTMKNVDSSNVLARYQAYLAEARRDFRAGYISAVMGTMTETLRLTYGDKEQHYTLYYYDQAGNLVRTVPPEGVRPLDTASTRALAQWRRDKLANPALTTPQPSVYTQHSYATTYTYNSLNQLISQDMPDHRRQDLWETEDNFVLPAGSMASALEFTSGGKGFLFANTTGSSSIYTSSDSGRTWLPQLQIGLDDLLDICATGGSVPSYFAVGRGGLFLKGTNQGKTWHLYTSPTTLDLISVHFSDAQNGRIVAADGAIWTTTDGGSAWSAANNALKSVDPGTITDIYHEGTRILVAAEKSGVAALYLSTNSGSSFMRQEFSAGPYAAVTHDGSRVLLGDVSGTLFELGSDHKLSVFRQTDLDGTIRRLVAQGGSYTALVTSGINDDRGDIYTSSDGRIWTRRTTSDDIRELGLLNGGRVSAATDAGTYGTSDDWSSFSAINAGGGNLNNLSRGVYLSGTITDKGGSAQLADREVVLASRIAYKDGSSWKAIHIENYYQSTKSMAVHAANDWLLVGGDNNLYRTQAGSSPHPDTLGLANSGSPVQSNIWNIYVLSNGLYALRTDNNNLVKLTPNSGGTVSMATQYSLPEHTNVWSITHMQLTANDAGGADMLVSFNDGRTWIKKGSASWQQPGGVQPAGLLAAASSGTETMYAGGAGGELYKRASGGDVDNSWTLVKLKNTAAWTIDDLYLDGSALRVLTSEGMKTYNASLAQVQSELSRSNLTEVWNNMAASADGTIYRRMGDGSWSSLTADGDGAEITDIHSNIASGTDRIYYLQSGQWHIADPVQIQPIYAMAEGSRLVAVGRQGTILLYNSGTQSWSSSSAGTTSNLLCVAANGSYMVSGAENGDLHYSTNGGTSWTSVSLPGSGPVRAVAVGSAQQTWALRGSQVLYSANGSSYTAVLSASQPLHGIHMDTDGYGFAVGDQGMAYRIQPAGSYSNEQKATAGCDANTPSVAQTLGSSGLEALNICADNDITDDKGSGIPASRLMRRVQFSDRLTGYMTGTGGLTLKTVDGGYHWQAETDGTGSATPLLALADGEHGTLVNGNGTVQTLRDRAELMGTRYWYDELGRPALNQNAKQYGIQSWLSSEERTAVPGSGPIRAYSYTLFDDIGRTIEVGELLTRQAVPILMHESQVRYDSIAQRFVHSGVRREITRSYYDEAVYTDIAPYFAQENLRPRVSSVTYQDKAGTAFDRATHYSYDVHGNVKTLIQQVRDGQRELKKRIDYDYDLVSGKINRIYYQKGASDQFIHRYNYDGDNRITGVQTSRDGIVWTQDAAYAYYAHGPLARAIIGDSLEIQDHAYTLQGWMKALNGQYFSYALGYFSGDYQSIGTNNNLATPVAASKDLYNGNIATMASLNPKLSATTWTQQFEYDQLNRIKASASIGLAHADAFRTGYRYDANGNIERLYRYNEAGDAFDSLVYHYENRAGGYLRNTNKLRWVDDSPGLSGHHTEDLEDQDMDNYRYDDLGNLVYDAQEEIARIEWNVYGKISKVIRTEASTRPDLEFLYDATGNRVAKIVKPKGTNATITYYIRDAQGNVLSVYKKSESGQTAELEEHYIYGSSRVGMLAAGGANNTRTLGLRSYELTDHLGNVRTVLSDKPTALGLTEMLAAYDYYPFGMIARSENSGLSRYLYNSMELDEESGLYVTEFRQYDPNTSRWISVDPRANEMPWLSPYVAFDNKPIIRNDPQGDCPTCGAAAAGAVVGALMDMVIQVGSHMADGHDMKTAISMINYADVGKEAGIGALAGLSGFGSARYIKKAAAVLKSPAGRAVAIFLAEQAVDMAVSALAEWGYETSGMEASMYAALGYNPKSGHEIGKIGEVETHKELKEKYKGQKVRIAEQVTGEFQDGARTIFDFVVTDEKGNVLEVVESKTNTARLTKNQRRFYTGGEAINFVGDNAAHINKKTAVSTTNTFASVYRRTVNRYTGTASKSTVEGGLRKLINKLK